jgi:hypothetical protein
MMRFAAYYGFTIDCNCNIAAYNLVIVGRNLPETCSGLNLARWLGTAGLNLRPVSKPPMGARGVGRGPIAIHLDFAAIMLV